MLVAATSNTTTTTLLGARRTPSRTPASSAATAGKLQLITGPTTTATVASSSNTSSGATSSSSASVGLATSSSSRSPVLGSLCVRISRDTNGFKALLNKIPSDLDVCLNRLKSTPLYTINPTITHRCPQILDIHSRDSLVADMCIFDPINPVPLTPYVRKECQSLKSPKFKYPSLKHRKFSLQINKTSSLLRVKLLKPFRPSAFCFMGSKLKSVDKIHAKRVIGKQSKESPSFGYGQLQSPTTTTTKSPSSTLQNSSTNSRNAATKTKQVVATTRRSRINNIRNNSLELLELQMSSTRPITRSFLRMMNNASKTK